MEGKKNTFRIGAIRPPSEANSLLLQMTEGCTWNRCKFCQLYKHCSFKAFSVDSIKEDIDVMARMAARIGKYRRNDGNWDHSAVMKEMGTMSYEEQNCFYLIYNWLAHGGRHVFLQDGNSLAVKSDRVVEVLRYLREVFPQIERITTYGRAETLSKISVEQYRQLRSAGLDRIHSGFESGSDEVLALIRKGVTAEQEILAGKRIKEAGIEISVYFMPGIGGKRLSRENSLGTARVVSAIDPDFVRLRTAVIKKGTELWQEYENGNFELCSENEKVEEIRLLIAHTKGCTGRLASDHIINLLQEVEGSLKKDREKMLGIIDQYLALPPLEQRLYQLARRLGLASSPKDMTWVTGNTARQLRQIAASITTEKEWDEKMNEMMMGYI